MKQFTSRKKRLQKKKSLPSNIIAENGGYVGVTRNKIFPLLFLTFLFAEPYRGFLVLLKYMFIHHLLWLHIFKILNKWVDIENVIWSMYRFICFKRQHLVIKTVHQIKPITNLIFYSFPFFLLFHIHFFPNSVLLLWQKSFFRISWNKSCSPWDFEIFHIGIVQLYGVSVNKIIYAM